MTCPEFLVLAYEGNLADVCILSAEQGIVKSLLDKEVIRVDEFSDGRELIQSILLS